MARKAKPKHRSAHRWSQRVTERSDALDLEAAVFRKGSARAVAASLKRSAEQSRRRKPSPYRSAMSMLTFYLNRAGARSSERKTSCASYTAARQANRTQRRRPLTCLHLSAKRAVSMRWHIQEG